MKIDFENVLFIGRTLAEYQAMFDLSVDDLRAGPILDCPAGAASFGAEARALGARVVCADALYGAPALVEKARADVARGRAYLAENQNLYGWEFYRSPEEHGETRERACRLFAGEFGRAEASGAYIAAWLPDLPFRDGAFQLALSAHLLFTYADRLDFAFHRETIRELVRVTRGEVRIFPLIDYRAVPYGPLDHLRDTLAAEGIRSDVRPVPYEFQRGGNHMLVLSRDASHPRAR